MEVIVHDETTPRFSPDTEQKRALATKSRHPKHKEKKNLPKSDLKKSLPKDQGPKSSA